MSCETKNPKLIPIAISCLQKLISHQAVPESSTALIIKTLSDQLGSTMELQLKILQTILPMITNYRSVYGDTLADALYLCYKLQDTKFPVVNSTAAVTFRQLFIHAFERLGTLEAQADAQNTSTTDADPAAIDNAGQPMSKEMRQCASDARLLFQDLCLLTSGEPASFLRVQSMSKGFGLELIESVLVSTPSLFQSHPELLKLLKERVCSIVIKSFSEKIDFSIAVRLIRVMQAIIKHFNSVLVMECEIFLSMYVKILESENIPLWQTVLVLEALKGIFAESGLQRGIFIHYDAKDHSTTVFHDMMLAIAKAVFEERGFLLGSTMAGDSGKETAQMGAALDGYSLSASGSSVKIQCLDQLEKTEPPAFPDTYPLFVAVQCILATVENIAWFILPILDIKSRSVELIAASSMDLAASAAAAAIASKGTSDHPLGSFANLATLEEETAYPDRSSTGSATAGTHAAAIAALSGSDAQASDVQAADGGPDARDSKASVDSTAASKNDKILLAIEMAKSASSSILAVLAILSTSLVDEEIFTWTLQAFQNYTVVVGLMGLTADRDAFLGAMCRVCVPSSSSLSFDFASLSKEVSPFDLSDIHGAARTITPPQSGLLTDRNVVCLRVLLGIAEALTPVMDNRTWFAVFETLQIAEGLMSTGKMGKRMESSPGLFESSSPSTSMLPKEFLRHRSTTLSAIIHPIFAAPAINASSSGTGGIGSMNAGPSENNFATFAVFVRKAFERTVNMDMRHFDEFVRALCRLAHETMAGAVAAQASATLNKDSMKVADEKSFAVSKLHDVAIANVKRLIQPADFSVWDLIIGQLIQMAHNPSCTVSIRHQVCTTFGEILNAAVQVADLTNPLVEMRILEPVRTLMAVDIITHEPSATGATALDDREKITKLAWLVDVQKSGLETLNRLLQINGQSLSMGWVLIFDVLQHVARHSRVQRRPRALTAVGPPPPGNLDAAGAASAALPAPAIGSAAASGITGSFPVLSKGFSMLAIDSSVAAQTAVPALQPSSASFADSIPSSGISGSSSSSSAAAAVRLSAILRIGFPCIQLICTDFLTLLPPMVLSRCIETVAVFGALSDDLNISLTAVGLLWTLCDYILTKRQALDHSSRAAGAAGDGMQSAVSASNLVTASADTGVAADQAASAGGDPPADSDSKTDNAMETALLNVHLLSGPLTTKSLDTLWMYLLGHLSELCADHRPEVRNSANQTLFRTLAMNGQRLTLDAWDQCIWHILFPLLERIRVSSERDASYASVGASAIGGGGGGSGGSGAIVGPPGRAGSMQVGGSDVKRMAMAAAAAQASGSTLTNTAMASSPMSPQTPRSPFARPAVPGPKQWDETKVLTLNGVTKCVLDFLHVLVDLGSSFDQAWVHFLEYIAVTCLEGSPEVSMAALKNLRLIVQYARPGASKPIAPNVAVKAADMWAVVWRFWVHIGQGIVAGSEEMIEREAARAAAAAAAAEKALAARQSIGCVDEDGGEGDGSGSGMDRVGDAGSMEGLDSQAPLPPASTKAIGPAPTGASTTSGDVLWCDGTPISLIHGFFTQDTISAYLVSFTELHDVIRPHFTATELAQYCDIARHLLVYHSTPLPGTTLSRLRADFVNDLEQLTPVQLAVLDIAAETKIEFSGIDTAPEILVLLVTDMIKLPFVPATPAFLASALLPPDATPTSALTATGSGLPLLRKMTYMALAKRSLQLLVALYERHGRRPSVYATGAFEQTLGALRVPMRLKYACPPSGTKDSTPVWRSAATACMTIIRVGLGALDALAPPTAPPADAETQTQTQTQLEPQTFNSIYSALLGLFEDFLLQVTVSSSGVFVPVLPPPTLSSDEVSADEAFDISLVTAIEGDVLAHLAQPHVGDAVISRLLDMLRRGSRLYLTTAATAAGGGLGGSVSESMLVMSPLALPDAGNAGTGGNADSSVAPGLGFDVRATGRENFAFTCLGVLFNLCRAGDAAGTAAGVMGDRRTRVAELAAPVLVDKCREVLRMYCVDRPSYGRLPMPRLRTSELLFVLQNIRDLDVMPGIFSKHLHIDAADAVRQHVLSGSSAHVFLMFDALVEVLGVVAGSAWATGGGSSIGTDSLVEAVRGALKRVGREFSL
ncbi:hypothetical protein BC831DRAFT_75969 [Entophlyctis helioformis]|nr:hypothetical protein BC831DRAFT_75969 [Entophlyctis helioformis]